MKTQKDPIGLIFALTATVVTLICVAPFSKPASGHQAIYTHHIVVPK